MEQKHVLVYGGAGALGRCIVKYLKEQNYCVCSLDIVENLEATANVLVDIRKDWIPETQSVHDRLRNVTHGQKMDAIINVAGGWAAGNVTSRTFLLECELMWREMVWSSTISAMLAAEYLKPNGVLILSGDAQSLHGTPGAVAYGLSKAAVHQLARSLGDPVSGLPKNTFVACLLPLVLDTSANRALIATSDFTKFTPLDYVAQLCEKWINDKDRPPNGSLVKITTENYESKTTIL